MKLALAAVVAAVSLAACSGPDEHIPPPVIIDAEVPLLDGPAIDASDADVPVDADLRCMACGTDQICVQTFDGTCGELGLACQDRDPTCATGTACTPDCDLHHCQASGDAGIFTCSAAGCPGEVAGALHCYGP